MGWFKKLFNNEVDYPTSGNFIVTQNGVFKGFESGVPGYQQNTQIVEPIGTPPQTQHFDINKGWYQ
jgi:hypothetical protein